MNNDNNLFSTLLASTVHDMKNSLGMMLDSLEGILSSVKKESQNASNVQYGIVQYEASRVNSSLMQLLALYKIENNQLPFTPGYHNLYDFVEEQILVHLPLFEAKGFTYQIDIDEEIEVVFDETLMAMVLSNIIGNAIRYTHSQIVISVELESHVSIIVNDDGPGYPGVMLNFPGDYVSGIDQDTGSTGLGLFFAQKVAQIHSHGDKQGKIQLANGGLLGGGVFKIIIP